MAYNPLTDTVLLYGGSDAAGGMLADTWEWNGQSWRYLAQGPTPVASMALAYDPVLHGVLMFGGFGPGALLGTWLWNGSSWIQVATSGPEPRSGAVCATDWSHARVLLHGGLGRTNIRYGDTWAWDGASWSRLDPGGSIPKRFQASMSYDWRRGQVFMGSGYDQDSGASVLNDLWTWTASGWQLIEEAPPRRSFATMASDTSEGGVVLFGGTGTGYTTPVFSDTWTLRGARWRRERPAVSPSSRAAHAMAYDAARGEVVLFGGMHFTRPNGPLIDLDDTWLWRQGQWRQAQPVHRPSPRRYACMAFDRSRQRMVLYGGGDSPYMNTDTWLWDGTDWTLAPTPAGPGIHQPGAAYDERRQRVVVWGRTDFANVVTREWTGTAWQFRAYGPDVVGNMVYDDRVGGCVVFGPDRNTGVGELWRWDGANWTLLQNHDLLRFSRMAAAYDWSGQRTVVFGGLLLEPPNATILGETWAYQAQTLTAHSREPLLGSTASWDLLLPASSARPFVVGLSGGADGIAVLTHPLGMPIHWPLAPDRLFLITFGLPSLVGVLDPTGRGTASLPLPGDPALDGLRLFASGITLGASLQPLDMTPAVSVVLTR